MKTKSSRNSWFPQSRPTAAYTVGTAARMEIRVDVKGVSCHGSAPERGDNAIYKMADILQQVRALNENGCAPEDEVKGLVKMLEPEFNPEHYEDARFLGRGTITVSQIFYTSPSRCAVARFLRGVA